MRTRVSRIPWFEVFTGASMSMTLLTNYRFRVGIGIGEAGLLIALLIGLTRGLGGGHLKGGGELWRMPALLLIYTVLLLLPLTLINFYAGTQGSSLRDWLAYLLCFSLIFALHAGRVDMEVAGKSFLAVLVLVLVYQFISDGLSSWYANRFTGGAKNPNQLALFCVCAALLVALFVHNNLIKWGALIVFCFFGIKARSDAYGAALAVVALAVVGAYLVPRKFIVPLGTPLLIASMALLLGSYEELLAFSGREWSTADEGGGRLVLYINGLRAWLVSIPSFLIGNGAGNFSGLNGPFQFSEAHNTPIDLLSIGGVVGLLLLYYFPIKLLARAYVRREVIVFSMILSLLTFSLFHFVARQPVWWFALYSACWMLYRTPSVIVKDRN